MQTAPRRGAVGEVVIILSWAVLFSSQGHKFPLASGVDGSTACAAFEKKLFIHTHTLVHTYTHKRATRKTGFRKGAERNERGLPN